MPKHRKLTAPEQNVLDVLAEGTTATTAVRLASDLFQRGTDSRFTFGDPVGFVTWLLEGLADMGYVKFRIANPGTHARDETPDGYFGLPFGIRLTKQGWDAAGYPHIVAEVGSPNRHRREVAPGDKTDYRNHSETSQGGGIEVLPWRQHRAKYPDHAHQYNHWWGEGADMPRDYVYVTPEMEDRVVQSFQRTGSYEKTAAETNMTVRRVKYIVNDRPSLGRDLGSLKQRALTLIQSQGPYPDVMALHGDLPGSHGLHNLVHVLHSLHKGQLIDFKEDRAGGNGTNYLNIRARSPLSLVYEGRDSSPTAQREPEPVAAFVAQAEPEVTTTTIAYPELDRIRDARAKYEHEKVKAAQYLVAAEALTNTDPETAELLLSKAAEAETTVLSPVEAEYMQYVEDHPDGTNPEG